MPSSRISGNCPQQRSDAVKFYVQTFLLEVRGAAGWEGAASPLQNVLNTSYSRASYQAPKAGELLQEYGDVDKTEVCGDINLVSRDRIQFDREGGRRDN